MTEADLIASGKQMQKLAIELNDAFKSLVGQKPQGILALHASMAVQAFALFEYAVMGCMSTLQARTDEAIEKTLAEMTAKNKVIVDVPTENEPDKVETTKKDATAEKSKKG